MKCCITGTSRGIGKVFREYFLKKGWSVISFNKQNSLEEIIFQSQDCDLFINNAYDKDLQMHLIKQLSTKPMIICGSIVTDYPDDEMKEYTQYKIDLENYFKQNIDKQMLLLKISGYAYNNPELLINSIEFWLNNPTVRVISFFPGDANK